MKIIMLGAPGAGKGTQAAEISKEYNIPHISTGDIFRSNIKNGTELGRLAKSYMDKGELVPDEVTVNMLLQRVAEADCANGYVLDGFPRTIPQAEVLEKELEASGAKVDFALNVDVPDESIVKRMSGRRSCPSCSSIYHVEFKKPQKDGICDKCGSGLVQRDDDKEETVKNRLSVYHEQTAPLIDFYERRSVLRTVDGTKDMEQVKKDIFGILKG